LASWNCGPSARRSPIHSSGILDTVLHQITTGSTIAYAILVLTLVLAPKIAEIVRLPAMVGLVLAGMALGPHGLHLLQTREIALSALGNFGLLYLMFSAGLELDVKLFMRRKKAAFTFAVLSFAFPFTLGILSARLLHYDWPAAVLMGSNWGSHTLVTYTMLRQMGLARNRAVSTVVGATTVTDTSALLVLSVVSGVVKPTGQPMAVQLGMIVVGLAVLVVWSLAGLPRVARWFFGRVGADRSYRFVFGIAAFLVGGVMAEAAGIDAIVGAFFAGLGLGRAIPEESSLMDRLQFTGSTVFIPIFLVSVGVLLEPRVMIDPKTLAIALVFTVTVLGGKALAAVVAGRAFHFTWPEVGVMSGLSGSQAAATLATTLVGAKLGLFDKQTINAVLVVILASLVVTPAMVSIFGKRVKPEVEGAGEIGKMVLVPVWGDSSRPALSLGGRLATSDGGIVLAATFAAKTAAAPELASQRKLPGQAESWLAKEGLESRTLFHVARTVPEGLYETIVDEDATLLVTEWRDRLAPGSEAAEALLNAPVPVLIAHGDVARFTRLLIVARPNDVSASDRRHLAVAAALPGHLGHGHHFALVAAAPESARALFDGKLKVEEVTAADPLAWLAQNLQATDLPVFAGIDAAREALRQLPALEAEGRFLVAQAAAQDKGPQLRTEPVTSPVVAGRSLRPRHA
jgi:Kef-type K+ transport system membrane component KefB